jgi:hypothetical protein
VTDREHILAVGLDRRPVILPTAEILLWLKVDWGEAGHLSYCDAAFATRDGRWFVAINNSPPWDRRYEGDRSTYRQVEPQIVARVLIAAGKPLPPELAEAVGGPPTPLDPIEQAAQLLVNSPEGVKLIRYLAGRPEHKAHLHDIAIALDKAPRATVKNTEWRIRARYLRAKKVLDGAGAPVRLSIEDGVIALRPAAAAAGDATQM